ncbi:Cof-type HAD-IIB family hydrolase [Evansella cellulosilytica]|uniref:Cof-like hydrolase n=1 Tax=Evansella cellulosilytica (strain ATCC 21833 / DSM 2522 / FERM P-1141 / JCM 9156 / N-4) TaxID=649639 RepID=E6TYA0_EVAC2|nr:Cof-type HAD-IIB family hydrolase [Evansella cellulosilytica]ADU32419.1 Cof-like hydrolase [Evansella cellulosilytica DSM 2522]
MQAIKLIALDMDGTLLNSDHSISDANRLAIMEAEQNGMTVVISTGRSILTLKPYIESLNLSSYIVTVNGSLIWDNKGEVFDQSELAPDLIKMMWDLKKKYDLHFWAVTPEKVWRDEFPEDEIEAHEWLKFCYHIEDDKTRKTVFEFLSKDDRLEITNSNPVNLEINAAGINKASALRKICEELGITMDNVLAMGDSLNDIAMIKEAGVGVAMGNAQPVVKDAADWVTTKNNEDGVALGIKKFALKTI